MKNAFHMKRADRFDTKPGGPGQIVLSHQNFPCSSWCTFPPSDFKQWPSSEVTVFWQMSIWCSLCIICVWVPLRQKESLCFNELWPSIVEIPLQLLADLLGAIYHLRISTHPRMHFSCSPESSKALAEIQLTERICTHQIYNKLPSGPFFYLGL